MSNTVNILLVEDDKALSSGLEYALLNKDFKVTAAYTKNQAEKEFSSKNFDFIILDVSLPDGNGFDFCKSVRSVSDIPVIFLTAKDEEVNVVMGLDIGGDDYITKPFRVTELISRIKAVLRRKKPGTDIINIYNLKIDTRKCNVTKYNHPVELTPTEYKLLVHLASNKGRVVTRKTILELLWDIDGDFVDRNTLTVYIRRLREKIEDNPSSPKIITTVRGKGYIIK